MPPAHSMTVRATVDNTTARSVSTQEDGWFPVDGLEAMEVVLLPGLNEKAIIARWQVAPGAFNHGVWRLPVEDSLLNVTLKAFPLFFGVSCFILAEHCKCVRPKAPEKFQFSPVFFSQRSKRRLIRSCSSPNRSAISGQLWPRRSIW